MNRTKNKLIEAQKQEIKVILASSRPTQAMLPIANELELDKYNGFLIAYNGGQIYDAKTKEILFDESLSVELTKSILKYLRNFNVVPMVDHEDYMYLNDTFFDIEYEIPAGYSNIVHYEARSVRIFKIKEVDDFNNIIK